MDEHLAHTGLAALKEWDRDEYAAGYRARLSGGLNLERAHHCWRCGWEDADTEALESARHNKALAEGNEDRFDNTWGLLLDAGETARANGIPFDDQRTEPWKEGWVAVDINLGVVTERES